MSGGVGQALVAQIGARRHYAVPRALHAAGLLNRLVTDASAEVAPWCWLDRLLPLAARPSALRRTLGRKVVGVPKQRISGLTLFSLSGALGRRGGESQTAYWARRNQNFAAAVARRYLAPEIDCVYGFNGAALELFRAARKRGIRTVLDQTAAPWRWNTRLLEAEAQQWPGWEDPVAEVDTGGHLADREEAEWALADVIVCGSPFVVDTLAASGGPVARCRVVAYPTPDGFAPKFLQPSERFPDQKLRVLFAGTLQLRKGIQYLVEAAEQLSGHRFEFRAVGPSLLSSTALERVRRVVDWRGAVPRAAMASHYAWAHVLVLPTLSEGSANVLHEGLASGLRVLTTRAAGLCDDQLGAVSLLTECSSGALVDALRALGEEHQSSTNSARPSGGAWQPRSFSNYAADLRRALEMSSASLP